ncbi:hypothetical protein [Halocella sp. SP3-1]|nr:hypothetical protein [Halocella sp. SP3-1]
MRELRGYVFCPKKIDFQPIRMCKFCQDNAGLQYYKNSQDVKILCSYKEE